MNRLVHLTLAIGLVLGLSSCADGPSIDASTPERLKQSSDLIRGTLAGPELQRYDQAVTLIIASVLDPIQTINLAAAGDSPTPQGVFVRIKPAFDGLDKDAIFAKGDSAAATVAQNVAAWKIQRAELEMRYRLYQAAAVSIEKVAATEVRLRSIEPLVQGLGVNQVMLDVTVTNGLDAPVDKATFLVSLMPPGVPTPWVTQPFTHAFDALPAGGTATFEVGPISVAIPAAYRGPVTLESQIVFQSLDVSGQSPIVLPTWTERDVVEISKLEAAIVEVENVLSQFQPPLATAPKEG